VVVLDAVVGALAVIAGIYLLKPGLADFGLYLEADRYRLAGGVLIYVGLVLGYASVFGLTPPRAGLVPQLANAALGTSGRLWCAALALYFATRAAISGWPPAWVALIAVSGVLAAANLPFASLARARAATRREVVITAASGKRPRFGFWSFLWRGVRYVIALVASVFVLVSVFFAYVLLDAAFIDGRTINVEYTAGVLAQRIAPIAAAAVAGALGVILLAGIVAAFGDRARRQRMPEFDRDLSADEVSLAARCVSEIRTYVVRENLAPLIRGASRTAWTTFTLFAAAGFILFLEIDRIIAVLYAPAGETWHLYRVAWLNTGAVALVAMLSLALVPRAVAKLLSRRVAEAGGARLIKVAAGVGMLEDEIVARVRDGSLAPGSSFDAGAFLRTLGLTTAAFALVWNALLAAGIAAWWPHERARDTLFTDAGIETGDFWSLQRATHPYEAVEAVFLKCELSASGGSAIGYTIVLPGFVERELVARHRLVAQLADTLRIDQKLRDAGASFVFALPDEARPGAEVVDRMCIVSLTEGMDDETRAQVERLLHLDEWFERRWHMRTGKQPRIVAN
jgi:hypothetical protein